MRMLVYKLIPK